MDPLDRLSQLVREQRSALAAVARAEGLSAEDAVDCLQEALSTFLDRLDRPPENWTASLTLMVKNAARNRRRRHHLARPHRSLEDHDVSDAPTAEDLIARAEETVRLRACVAGLCEIQRAVVTLRMLEEQPGEDVARALGISAGHVAVLLHRAKAALRACMTA
jgi:RNA polymerase sigma-70 factor (ECF subfamily)